MHRIRKKLGLCPEESPDLNQIFNLLLPLQYVVLFLETVNRAFESVPFKKLTFEEVQSCLLILFHLHYYRCSPERLFEQWSLVKGGLYGAKPPGAEKHTWDRFVKGMSFCPNALSNGVVGGWTDVLAFDNSITECARSKFLEFIFSCPNVRAHKTCSRTNIWQLSGLSLWTFSSPRTRHVCSQMMICSNCAPSSVPSQGWGASTIL